MTIAMCTSWESSPLRLGCPTGTKNLVRNRVSGFVRNLATNSLFFRTRVCRLFFWKTRKFQPEGFSSPIHELGARVWRRPRGDWLGRVQSFYRGVCSAVLGRDPGCAATTKPQGVFEAMRAVETATALHSAEYTWAFRASPIQPVSTRGEGGGVLSPSYETSTRLTPQHTRRARTARSRFRTRQTYGTTRLARVWGAEARWDTRQAPTQARGGSPCTRWPKR